MKNFLSKIKTERVYVFLILLFGMISVFVTFPLGNGDEGYHLSKSYNIFSMNHPKSMKKTVVRQLEYQAIGLDGDMKDFDVETFYIKKLKDVEKDSFRFNIAYDRNITMQIDIAHIPAAIGVMVGRVIYPSYGIMLLCSRISSLLFFALCMGAIIKKSTVGKWTLFMLFSIPCIQKLASPSYDVFSYVVFAMYSMNIFELAKLRTIKEISKQKILYTLITIILLLFCKKNYLFALAVIPFLPMFFLRILDWLDNKKMSVKIVTFVTGIIVMLVLLVGLNYYLNLFSLFKAFMKSYFNMATMGDRGKFLFSVVPTILPEIFNLLWIVSTFLIVLGENAYNWNRWFTYGGLLEYLVNWMGIFTGFNLIMGKTSDMINELDGRYLHPYMLYLVPVLQRFSKKNKIKVNSTTIAALAIITVVIIYSVYLFTCFYRGYILNITATWVS